MARRRRKPLPKEPVEIVIDRLGHDGRGIGSIDGKTVFVDGALPGETVECLYTSKRSKFDEARATKITNAAAQRVEPPCEHASLCGGCSLQHMSNDAQVALKEGVLLEQLKHFGQSEPEVVLSVLRADTLGYRRKARLGARYVTKKESTLVGFREKRSSFLAELNQCEVLIPVIGKNITGLRELINGLSCRSEIPQLEVSAGDTETVLIVRHLAELPQVDLDQIVKFSKDNGLWLYLQPGGYETLHKVWPADDVNRLSYSLPTHDVELLFHPLDFTQVNASINQLMVDQALRLLDVSEKETVLDLFCGLGNFTIPLAKYGAHVTGVEGSEAMVERGLENASHNGVLEKVAFYAANLDDDFSEKPWAQTIYDKLLIDPPRSGALKIVENIERFKAKRIVYVSCNPATLARDAGILKDKGYRLTQAGVMDMFPHTTHVESMAVFEI